MISANSCPVTSAGHVYVDRNNKRCPRRRRESNRWRDIDPCGMPPEPKWDAQPPMLMVTTSSMTLYLATIALPKNNRRLPARQSRCGNDQFDEGWYYRCDRQCNRSSRSAQRCTGHRLRLWRDPARMDRWSSDCGYQRELCDRCHCGKSRLAASRSNCWMQQVACCKRPSPIATATIVSTI